MHHEKAIASMHLDSDRARAESLNATANDLNQSRAPLPITPMLPRFKESEGNIDAYCCERLKAYLMTIGRRSGLTTLGRTWQFHVTRLDTTANNYYFD